MIKKNIYIFFFNLEILNFLFRLFYSTFVMNLVLNRNRNNK